MATPSSPAKCFKRFLAVLCSHELNWAEVLAEVLCWLAEVKSQVVSLPKPPAAWRPIFSLGRRCGAGKLGNRRGGLVRDPAVGEVQRENRGSQ